MGSEEKSNPWLSIWVEPKKTIRSIVKDNPKKGFIALSALYGLPLAFNLMQSFAMSSVIPAWAVVIAALVICPFLGMLGISIGTALLYVTGKWIGGKGSFQTVRTAVAWSNVPAAVTVMMWVMLLGVFGSQVLSDEFSQMQFVGYQSGIVFLAMLIETIVSVWGFVILLNGLAEVQGFSVYRAILNVLIPLACLVALIWGFSWVLSAMGTT